MKKSKKKHRKFSVFHLLFWLFIIAGGFWIAFAPRPHAPNTAVHVRVEQPPLPPEPPATPPQQTEIPPVPPENPSVGDERAQPQVAVPVVPEHEPVLPPGHKAEIAIVIDDVGLDMRGSKRAIDLPGFVTLSFMPYATRLKEQTKEARDNGHELMLHMPMEPMGHDDPGPGALLVDLPMDELRQRFENALASFVGFDGVNNHMGSKFTAYPEGMEMVIDELQQRNLFFLDSRTSAKTVGESIARQHNLPTIGRDIFLDDDMSIKAVKAQLVQTERVARRKGYAVAIGHPHAATLEALEAWLPDAQARGFVFVPVHDLIGSHE